MAGCVNVFPEPRCPAWGQGQGQGQGQDMQTPGGFGMGLPGKTGEGDSGEAEEQREERRAVPSSGQGNPFPLLGSEMVLKQVLGQVLKQVLGQVFIKAGIKAGICLPEEEAVVPDEGLELLSFLLLGSHLQRRQEMSTGTKRREEQRLLCIGTGTFG